MGPTWGRQNPGGPHVGRMILAIWEGLPIDQPKTQLRYDPKLYNMVNTQAVWCWHIYDWRRVIILYAVALSIYDGNPSNSQD